MKTTTFLLIIFFFFNDTATTEIYTLSLHDALPIPPLATRLAPPRAPVGPPDLAWMDPRPQRHALLRLPDGRLLRVRPPLRRRARREGLGPLLAQHRHLAGRALHRRYRHRHAGPERHPHQPTDRPAPARRDRHRLDLALSGRPPRAASPAPAGTRRGRQPPPHRDRIAARWLRRSARRRRCCGGTVNSPGSATHSRQAPCGCCSPGQPGTVAKLLGLRILLRAVAGPEVDPSTNGLGSYCCGGLGARTRPPQGSVRTMARSVHPTCHNPNIPPPATPLVNGPLIRLPGHHGKVRRDGYRADRT